MKKKVGFGAVCEGKWGLGQFGGVKMLGSFQVKGAEGQFLRKIGLWGEIVREKGILGCSLRKKVDWGEIY